MRYVRCFKRPKESLQKEESNWCELITFYIEHVSTSIVENIFVIVNIFWTRNTNTFEIHSSSAQINDKGFCNKSNFTYLHSHLEIYLHTYVLGCGLFSVFEISKSTFSHKCSLVWKLQNHLLSRSCADLSKFT